ncbi:MAG: AAA family ATPase, partial [Isosphaeraceae bacterium]
MRIDRLDLTAFGPFTEVSLDLSAGTRGLHLVFGPNEAGKSSAVRAITQFFQGIPHQSADDFVHKYDKIRIGAALRGREGDVVELVRRKGVKNTLLSVDGAPLSDGALTRLLGGTPPEDFIRRFVIDHEELVAGGRDLVAGRGDLGRALFAAGGGGLARVGGVQKELEKEAEGLFLPRGSKPSINADLTGLESLRKELRDKALPSSDWVRHDAALREAHARREAIEREREETERERNRLLRLAEAVEPVAHRREVLDALAGLAGVPRLSRDFSFRLRDARSRLPSTERAAEAARRRLKELAIERDRLDVPEALLDQSEAIESLHSRLARVGQAESDRHRLEAERVRLASEIREALRDLGRDPALATDVLAGEEDGPLAPLRVSKIDRASLDDLVARCESVPRALAAARKDLDDLSGRREGVEARLLAMGPERDPSPLKQRIKESRQAGDLDGAIQQAREALERDEARALASIAALEYWSGPIEAAETLAVPSVEVVEDFQANFESIDREAEDLGRRREEAEAADRLAGSELERLRLEGDVPTEEGLSTARGRRDDVWRHLRAAWDDALADTFEDQSRAADEAADRLRR